MSTPKKKDNTRGVGRITYAQFNIERRGKMYAVQMGVQHTHENATSAHVTVITMRDDGSKRVILTRSVKGRQAVSPFNAKKHLRDALVAEGVIKEREKKDPQPERATIVRDSGFDNEARTRYYGLRVGDVVKSSQYRIERAEVVGYGFMDNNSVVIQEIRGKKRLKPRDVVAEWCTIITKVEDLNKNDLPKIKY